MTSPISFHSSSVQVCCCLIDDPQVFELALLIVTVRLVKAVERFIKHDEFFREHIKGLASGLLSHKKL